VDLQHVSGSAHRLEILTAVVPQTEVQTLAGRGLPDHLGVAFELIADCGSNEIGPVRVKALLYHQVDLPEVDVAEIDRDLLAVTEPWTELMYVLNHVCHPIAICMDGTWMSAARFSRGEERSQAWLCRRRRMAHGIVRAELSADTSLARLAEWPDRVHSRRFLHVRKISG
jgi:hypothetical protein